MKTLIIITILSLLGMSFYLNNKIEHLEAQLATIDTIHAKVIIADTIFTKSLGSNYLRLQEEVGYSSTVMGVFSVHYFPDTDVRKTEQWENKLWIEILK